MSNMLCVLRRLCILLTLWRPSRATWTNRQNLLDRLMMSCLDIPFIFGTFKHFVFRIGRIIILRSLFVGEKRYFSKKYFIIIRLELERSWKVHYYCHRRNRRRSRMENPLKNHHSRFILHVQISPQEIPFLIAKLYCNDIISVACCMHAKQPTGTTKRTTYMEMCWEWFCILN